MACESSRNEQIVWQATLDGRYEVVVVRVGPYRGKQTIYDAGDTIFGKDVGLMCNAQFGPDIADVADRSARRILAILS